MSSYSDYTKPQINIEALLPEVYRSDVNKTLSGLVLDRHFSKDDTVRVSGYIGTGNPNALVKRQVIENGESTNLTAHRQAFQLTPTMYTKVGAVERALSFQGFLTQLRLQGVNIDQIKHWGAAERFNWVPPVNLDMLVNYQDYFWNSTSTTDLPQYFTIENRCAKKSDKVKAYELIMNQRGQQYPVISVDLETNSFVVAGSLANIFSIGTVFQVSVSNATALSNKFWSVKNLVIDGNGDTTTLTVAEKIAPNQAPPSPTTGDWWYDTLQHVLWTWDSTTWVVSTDIVVAQITLPALFPIINSSLTNNSLTISGKQDDLFVPGFLFTTKDSILLYVQNRVWTTQSSTYDVATHETTVKLVELLSVISSIPPTSVIVGTLWLNPNTSVVNLWDGTSWGVTSPTITGNISLSEMLSVFQSELTCQCSGERGWDAGGWDDNNIGNVLWNVDLLQQISHPTEAAWLNYNVDNVELVASGAPVVLALWLDTTMNQLKQYGDALHPIPSDPLFSPSWIPLVSNISTVLEYTTGAEMWDASSGCIPQVSTDWTLQNKWSHKTAVKSHGSAIRAQLPILEFDSNVELNKWTRTTYVWKYRATSGAAFVQSSGLPSRLELEPAKGYFAANVSGIWTLYLFDNTVGTVDNTNLTTSLPPGKTFRIVDDSLTFGTYTVKSVEYTRLSTPPSTQLTGNSFTTVVQIEEQAFQAPLVGGGTNNIRVVPNLTSQGDSWTGYHNHWLLDEASSLSKPIEHQQENPFVIQDSQEPGVTDVVAGNPLYATFHPQVGAITHGSTYQLFTVDVTTATRVDLIRKFKYVSTLSNTFATPGSGDLRVYVNNVRQYGTYKEHISSEYVNYVAVGTTTISGFVQQYVDYITFSSPLRIGDVVRLEVGVAAFNDLGMSSVPVRTVENDAAFLVGVSNHTQPVYRSLTRYNRNEQTKNTLNQYPLFNIFDVITGKLTTASPVLTFREDASLPVNGLVHKRIRTTSGVGVEFEFDNHLLDGEDGVLYAYRDQTKPIVGQYWYSPTNNTLNKWDGSTWASKILVNTGFGTSYIEATISTVAPVEALNVNQALWVNPTTAKLYTRNVSNHTWIELPVVVNDADPTLCTIWKAGNNLDQYVPSYVDRDRKPTTIGSPIGSWEVLEQWYLNPEHNNKKYVKYTQLATHFRTIIANQPPIPGFANGGIYNLLHSEYDYGVGGTIREYNGAFDTLISAINVESVTPVGILTFASNEYAAGLRNVRDIFNRTVVDLFVGFSARPAAEFTKYVTDTIISTYESNDYTARLYGDSSAWKNGVGVQNWIATAPMLGLVPAFRPHLVITSDIIQLFHHDGHRSSIYFTSAEEDMFIRKIISLEDTRSQGFSVGKVGVATPTFVNDFLATYGGSYLRNNVFFYVPGSPRRFYRFELYRVSDHHPALLSDNVELPNGTSYYNSNSNNVFVKNGMTWEQATPVDSYDISPLWKIVDFRGLLGSIYLELENRLYAACEGVTPVFDYNQLRNTPQLLEQYNNKQHDRFDEYVANQGIVAPLINNQYRQTDAFTWNYALSAVQTPPYAAVVDQLSSWQMLYQAWYNTPYPHLEPWKLQGFHDKPIWWDEEYLESSNTRAWKFIYLPTNSSIGVGMWENIRIGKVPVGRTYPSGVVSTGNPSADGQSLRTYTYFSVNISNGSIGTIDPDQLLPPYIATQDAHVRSLFPHISQVISPEADYTSGSGSVIEWHWMISSQYNYDQAIVAFLMSPIKFLRASFGAPYTLVNGLEVDILLKKVYNHREASFHGDLIGSTTYQARGLNQWYVNYNRFTGYDVNAGFRDEWNNWTPLLTYQTGSVIDTSTFDVTNKHFDVSKQDYKISLVNTGAIKELWVDSFDISILEIAPGIIQYNNQGRWKLEISSTSSVARTIYTYGVKSYPFVVDAGANLILTDRYKIIDVDAAARRWFLHGNETNKFTPGARITISDTLYNDGEVEVTSVTFVPASNLTRITVSQPIAGEPISGYIIPPVISQPWATGDMVVVSSTNLLPSPLVPTTPYYVVNVGDGTIRLAETFNDALSGVTIEYSMVGNGVHTISEISSSFNVMGGDSHSKDTWYHYTLDKNKIQSIELPHVLYGMQSLVDLIDGYSEYQVDTGVIVNSADSSDFDPVTGRLSNWSVELERFIDWAYGLRGARLNVSDRIQVTADVSTSLLTATGFQPNWPTGTPVKLISTGTLPAPLVVGETYYIYNTNTPGVFGLSVTQDTTYLPLRVELITDGSGDIFIATKDDFQSYPSFEINPHRNNVWIDTPFGVLSDVAQGPYADIKIRQILFDQYGRKLEASNIAVYRQDKRSRVSILPNLTNDVDLFYTNDPYNYIHLGGGHFFLEGFEHYILFNQHTSDGKLLYEPFFGLQVAKLEVNFLKAATSTLRPSVGGYFLKGQEFFRNIEGSASDLANYYETNNEVDGLVTTKYARALLGYNGNMDFLDLLNSTPQSKFTFYRGMINSKGSSNSVLAYINSRHMVDAKIDEFWAVKLAEFGDNRTKVYPEILLLPNDNTADDLRFEFVGLIDDPLDPRIQSAMDNGFKIVSYADDARWNEFPDQQASLPQPLFLPAELSDVERIFVYPVQPPARDVVEVDYWFNSTNHTVNVWSGVNWVEASIDKIKFTSSHVYWALSSPADDVRVIRREMTAVQDIVPIVESFSSTNTSFTTNAFSIKGDYTNDIYSGSSIVVTNAGANSSTVGAPFVVNTSWYDSFVDLTYINIVSDVPVNGNIGNLQYTRVNFGFYNTKKLETGTYGVDHYFRVNSEVVRFDVSAFTGIVDIYAVRPAFNVLTPAMIVHKQTDTVHDSVSLWHPAYGIHYHKAAHNIDLRSSTDPAVYGVSVDPTNVPNRAWNYTEAGTVWLDTSKLGYVPYYDDVIYKNLNDRLYKWGELADYAEVKLYQWVNSAIHPSDWDSTAASQVGNLTISDKNKVTGIAKKTLFKRTRSIYPGSIRFGVDTTITSPLNSVSLDQQVFISSHTALPQELDGVVASVTNVTRTAVLSYNLVNSITGEIIVSPVPTNVIKIIDIGTSTTNILVVEVATGQLADGDTILLSAVAGGALPVSSPQVVVGVEYRVVRVSQIVSDVYDTFSLETLTGGAVVFTGVGVGPLVATTASKIINVVHRFDNNWVKQVVAHKHIPGALIVGSTASWAAAFAGEWVAGDDVIMYSNGVKVASAIVQFNNNTHRFQVTIPSDVSITEVDYLDIIRHIKAPTALEQAFDPDVQDDGATLVQWKDFYEYTSTIVAVGSNGSPTVLYNFWVEGSTSRNTRSQGMSLTEITSSLQRIPSPYYIVQRPLDANSVVGYGYGQPPYGTRWESGEIPEFLISREIMYREAIVRNISNYAADITDYLIRFTEDATLRDRIDTTKNLKDTHEEWLAFRRNQLDNVAIHLWLKMVEALSGVSGSTPVPALNRVLYDAKYGTDTRFGLQQGQAFVDQKIGLATLMNYLRDPSRDFSPVNIDKFLADLDTTTSAGITTALMDIYNTFGAEHVNGIWFEILQDALANKKVMKGLLKTSWIALHGIKLLEVNGIFDD